MTEVDQVLVGPTRAALEAALAASAAAVNRRAKQRRLPWPPDDLSSFAEELAAAPEGYRQWNGGDDQTETRPYGRGGMLRSTLATAWWTDHVGRKHVRLLGRRGKLGVPELARLMWPEMPRRRGPLTPVPLLALVYREFTFLRVRDGQRQVRVVCRCGVSGEPGAVGWMGDCCGPCHDRRQSGEAAPPAVAGRFVFRPEGGAQSLAFSPDGNTLLVGAGPRLLFWDLAGGRELFALACEGGTRSKSPWRPTAAPWRRRATTGPGPGTACPTRRARRTSRPPTPGRRSPSPQTGRRWPSATGSAWG